MIFVTSVLTMNGGTTFLIRVCDEMKARGESTTVLVLRSRCDPQLLAKLSQVAHVIFLKDYLLDKGLFFRSHLGIFGLVDWKKLIADTAKCGEHFHALGSFGLLFVRRLKKRLPQAALSAGVYHQNEFLFYKVPFFVTQLMQDSFSMIPPRNVVFFNTSSRNNYTSFFQRDYASSPILPIGISLKGGRQYPDPPKAPQRIVSIGNLVPFKTYNRHVITALADLSNRIPELTYDIYGDGRERDALAAYAENMGVGDKVNFLGTVSYDRFADHVRDATVFVGSGTAVLEAASLAVPALIGIESLKQPLTYGFLHEIPGFSYNEDDIGLPKRSILACLEEILFSSNQREEVGHKCHLKAQTFSIQYTVDGFNDLMKLPVQSFPPLSWSQTIRAALSFVWLGIFERLTGKFVFSDRRSQSYTRRMRDES